MNNENNYLKRQINERREEKNKIETMATTVQMQNEWHELQQKSRTEY